MHDRLHQLPYAVGTAATEAVPAGGYLHAAVLVARAGDIRVRALDVTAELVVVEHLVVGYAQRLARMEEAVHRLDADAAPRLVLYLKKHLVDSHARPLRVTAIM